MLAIYLRAKMWTISVLLAILFCKLVTSHLTHTSSKQDEHRARNLYYAGLPGVTLRADQDFIKPVVKHDEELIKSLPESYDPRDKWPNCPSLKEIRDQGKCGGCWALSVVAAMTDRVCILSNGTENFHFSAEDLLTCSQHDGCQGGDSYASWHYWVTVGIVSGGNYGSNEGCRPYSILTCPHHITNCTHYSDTPECKRYCRKEYEIAYNKDRHRGKRAYTVDTVEDMMAEVYKNGPITVCFAVYEDFANYTGGVYHHVAGKRLSGHAVKLMGWGVENGKKYWLLANSWGTDFGEKGFFKILRGTNECGIEQCQNAAALPLLSYY